MNIIKKMKSSLLVVATMFTVAVPALVPATIAFADCSEIGKAVGAGASGAATGTSDTTYCAAQAGIQDNDIATIASKIVNIFSMIVGAVAVIMVIFGGFRYITSGGDSGRVGSAKNTLIYAIVGLIIVALAQLIVHFVINFSSRSVTGTG